VASDARATRPQAARDPVNHGDVVEPEKTTLENVIPSASNLFTHQQKLSEVMKTFPEGSIAFRICVDPFVNTPNRPAVPVDSNRKIPIISGNLPFGC